MGVASSIAVAAASCLAALAVSLGIGAVQAAEPDKADVVLRNAKIYTADPSRSIQQALAFTGNTIVAVGSDADVGPLIRPKTKVVDLGGKLVLPGLIDTHIHPIVGAVNGSKCSLAGVKATIKTLKPVIRACLDKDEGGSDEWFEAVQLEITDSRRRRRTSTASRLSGQSRSRAMIAIQFGSITAGSN
jgi:predicted amidohydrolase YtcJ